MASKRPDPSVGNNFTAINRDWGVSFRYASHKPGREARFHDDRGEPVGEILEIIVAHCERSLLGQLTNRRVTRALRGCTARVIRIYFTTRKTQAPPIVRSSGLRCRSSTSSPSRPSRKTITVADGNASVSDAVKSNIAVIRAHSSS
jgi:hypothetical protein